MDDRRGHPQESVAPVPGAPTNPPAPPSSPATPALGPGEPVSAERIREIFERNAQALALRPALGRGTATSRARIVNGLFCEVREGPWSAIVRQGREAGGDSALPNPGVLGRAALGSCLAISYSLWAAHLGVPVRALEVEVHTDYDSGGLYGIGDARPGYTAVRWVVTIDSAAPRDQVERMLALADAHCPYVDVFANPQPTSREVRYAGETADAKPAPGSSPELG